MQELSECTVIPSVCGDRRTTTVGGVGLRCNTLPITTVYTVTKAVLAPSTVLDLSSVPAQQLMLFSMH
jgi:hypothetical protein